MHKGILWLIPTPLGSNIIHRSLPQEAISIIQNLNVFIVENEKVSRKFLRDILIKVSQKEIVIVEFGKHQQKPIKEYLKLFDNNQNVGLMSDAGCPGIADPGSAIALAAHSLGIQIKPLVGPSSIFLGLMASGFNGQNFVFHGYLPIDKTARRQKLKQLESISEKQDQTQIFIETPYRNNSIIGDILEILKPSTQICIAAGLSTDQEFIKSQSVLLWNGKVPDLNNIPTLFLIYKGN